MRAMISAAGTNVHDGFLCGHPTRVPKAATEGLCLRLAYYPFARR